MTPTLGEVPPQGAERVLLQSKCESKMSGARPLIFIVV